MIDNSWKLIEWKTICLLCPYVDEMFNKKDFESEFNLNYNSFINDIDNLVDITCLVNQWWNEQTSDTQFVICTFRDRGKNRMLEKEFIAGGGYHTIQDIIDFIDNCLNGASPNKIRD